MTVTAPESLDTLFPDGAVSASTKKQYINQVKKWMKLSTTDSVEHIITTHDACIRLLDTFQQSDHSKKLMVAAICALIKHNDVFRNRYRTAGLAWSATLKKMNKSQFDRDASLEPTQREIVNWVEWSDVLKKERELAEHAFGSDEHLVLALYTHLDPMRADFGHVRIAIDKKNAKQYDSARDNHLYLTHKPGKSFIVLHTYKTAKSYGRFARYIPDGLARIIAANLDSNPREWLVVDVIGRPYANRNSFVKFTNRILECIFEKKFTIRLLRHSRISAIDFNSTTPKELLRIGKNMQHSIGMQQMYRKKIPVGPLAQAAQAAQAAPVAPGDVGGVAIDIVSGAEKKKTKKKKKKSRKTERFMETIKQFRPDENGIVVI